MSDGVSPGTVSVHVSRRLTRPRRMLDDPLAGVNHLLRCLVDRFHDDVYDHGNQRQSEQQIDGRCEEELGMVGNDVTESDGTQGDEGEVESLQVGPVFPGAVQEGPEDDVQEGDYDGNYRRQVKRVIDLVRDKRSSWVPVLPKRLVPIVVPLEHRDRSVPESDGCSTADVVAHSLEEGSPETTDRDHPPDVLEGSGEVESADEGPEELDAVSQRLPELRQDDETQRNAESRIDHRNDHSQASLRVDVSITYATRGSSSGGISQFSWGRGI